MTTIMWKSSFLVSGFNIMKSLTLLVDAGLFGCFCNPSNSDMDYRIFNMKSVQTDFDSGQISGRAQSLAHNGHPSIWWSRSIVLNFGFRIYCRKTKNICQMFFHLCFVPIEVSEINSWLGLTAATLALHRWLSWCGFVLCSVHQHHRWLVVAGAKRMPQRSGRSVIIPNGMML